MQEKLISQMIDSHLISTEAHIKESTSVFNITTALYKHLHMAVLSTIINVCVSVCGSVLCQLWCGLPAAYCLLLHDALLSGSASVCCPVLLCQHPLPGAPPSWHPAVPPQGLPTHILLESWPVEQGETEIAC